MRKPLSVGLKIGSEFVRVHDTISIIAKVSPQNCIINDAMKPVLNGVATFTQAIFTGYIGQCSITFEAFFHDSSNTKATYQQSIATTIKVIASHMTVVEKLPSGTLEGGSPYNFKGKKEPHYCAKQTKLTMKIQLGLR
jgi:hypothetical protein